MRSVKVKTVIDGMGNRFSHKEIYDSNYKFETTEDYEVIVPFQSIYPIKSIFYSFSFDVLKINRGYKFGCGREELIWNYENERASCIHNVLYQMIRTGELHPVFKDKADRLLSQIMIEDSRLKKQVVREDLTDIIDFFDDLLFETDSKFRRIVIKLKKKYYETILSLEVSNIDAKILRKAKYYYETAKRFGVEHCIPYSQEKNTMRYS